MFTLFLRELVCNSTDGWVTDDNPRLRVRIDGAAPRDFDDPEDIDNGEVWDLTTNADLQAGLTFQQSVTIQLFNVYTFLSDDDLGTVTISAADLGAGTRKFNGNGSDYDLDFTVNPALDPTPGPLPSPANAAGDLEADKGACRWVLSLDGGGLRGMITLLSLAELERYYGAPAGEMFDMFAGTSTGSIVAAMLATGHSVADLIKMYNDLDTRRAIFTSNKDQQDQTVRNITVSPGWTVDRILYWLPFDHGLAQFLDDTVSPMVATPKYKKGIKSILASTFTGPAGADLTLKDCSVGSSPKDIFITTKDMFRSETTYLTAFHYPGSRNVRGTYRDMKIKDAVELSMSAPIYFDPRERFVDGGVGSYNNPCFAAAIEALRYSGVDADAGAGGAPFYQPYQEKTDASGNVARSGTVVWSFGTTDVALQHVASDLETEHLVNFWAEYVVDEAFWDANEQQVYLCRNVLKDVKFMRFNLTLTVDSLIQIGFTDRTPDQLNEMIGRIKMDAVEEIEFGAIREVGMKFAAFLTASDAFDFSGSGLETGRDFNQKTPIKVYRDQVLAALNSVP